MRSASQSSSFFLQARQPRRPHTLPLPHRLSGAGDWPSSGQRRLLDLEHTTVQRPAMLSASKHTATASASGAMANCTGEPSVRVSSPSASCCQPCSTRRQRRPTMSSITHLLGSRAPSPPWPARALASVRCPAVVTRRPTTSNHDSRRRGG